MEAVVGSGDLERMQGWLRIMTESAESSRLRDAQARLSLALAEGYLQQSQPLRAELLLGRLCAAGSPEVAEKSHLLMAACLESQGKFELALQHYDEIVDRWGDDAHIDGRADGRIARTVLGPYHAGWPPDPLPMAARQGQRRHPKDIASTPRTYSQLFPVELRSATSDWPQGTSLAVQHQGQATSLLVIDEFGNNTLRIPIQSVVELPIALHMPGPLGICWWSRLAPPLSAFDLLSTVE